MCVPSSQYMSQSARDDPIAGGRSLDVEVYIFFPMPGAMIREAGVSFPNHANSHVCDPIWRLKRISFPRPELVLQGDRFKSLYWIFPKNPAFLLLGELLNFIFHFIHRFKVKNVQSKYFLYIHILSIHTYIN